MTDAKFRSWLCGQIVFALFASLSFAALIAAELNAADTNAALNLVLRTQVKIEDENNNYHVHQRSEAWDPQRTAVIVCDMWDSHHCVNAVRRGAEIAPRIDQLADAMREQGATIIHAPSGCMEFYSDHPARKRALGIQMVDDLPTDIGSWCDQIPAEEAAEYPLDQAAGGEDDAPADHAMWEATLKTAGLDPSKPWTRQSAAIQIDESKDYISDDGKAIWSLLQSKQIDNVMLLGVHTNMCVLGRPFGLRRLAQAGKNVVLVRDLTDTMYDPNQWPYVSHFTGNDLIVSHIERHVCPTISSEQVLGGQAHRFANDDRKTLLMIIAEDEYKTEATLPQFARVHLGQHYRVEYALGSETERNIIVNLEAVERADAILISVRRRALPKEDLQRIRDFVAAGKPVIGIRTASHAFALRKEDPPAGHDVWPTFDQDVWGGAYDGHFGNTLQTTVKLLEPEALPFRIEDLSGIVPGGSLYKNVPIAPGTIALLEGTVPEQSPHPLAWTFVRRDGGRSFYTSLGHEAEFEQPAFCALLLRGIAWATDTAVSVDGDSAKMQMARYAAGKGRQR